MASQSFYAVIAGAGSGTGRAAAVRFSKAYPVVLLARKAESFDETVEQINSSGGHAIGIASDATDAESLDAAFETIKQKLPDSKLVAAVYNVNSKFTVKPFLELSREDLENHLNAGP